MIVGPTKTLFMDEISTGLDTSTTFQILKCLQQIVHLTEATIFMSLLQPAPETFNLFDDIIFLSEGQIVYQGPRDHVLDFFECCGFKCPDRKGTADFLQEVTSRKNQEQYWADKSKPYQYISVTEFANRFKSFYVGLRLENEVSVPYDKTQSHNAALVYKKYSVPKIELLKACFEKEWLLIKRNSFIYVFKTVQIIIVAIIASTVFIRTQMHTRNEEDGAIYVGALLFSMIVNMFNGFAEMALTVQRLPVFYKQRDLFFHPPWAFTLPNFLLRIPISVFESIVWMVMTYYAIGFAPEASRFFKQLLVVFLVQQTAAGMFRLTAGVGRTMILTNTGGALTALLVFLLGGFILPKGQIPKWWKWGYWLSPMSYGFNALAVNEMFAPRWMNKLASDNVTALGVAVLKNFDVFPERNWFWIGAATLLGFVVVFNVLFTLALMYLNPLGKPQVIISKEVAREMEGDQEESGKVFVDEVMDLVELNNLKDAIVGLPGITGLSREQRKRLTVAVELVTNPSIIFMDEPTSGLDARAAAIVMRTVRNTVDTGRTVVCTIHQPSIDIFEAFDELLLMKSGGQVIYSGPLGRNSQKIIEYFEAIPGVTKIKEKYNPATWMLEASSIAVEVRLGIDFADYYKSSNLYQDNTTDLTTIIGAMYAAVLFVGIKNCNSVQPLVAIERTVFYREKAAGMYSALPYALAQVIAEIPYVLVQSIIFSLMVYTMVGFEWTTHKFFWFFFVTFISFLYFTYYGMMIVSITPNHQVASIFAAAFYSLFNLFSGFFIPRPKIPKWWIWYYWICPVAWTVYGLIVSQYGDIEDTIKVPGMVIDPTIKWYVQHHFGYEQNFIKPIAGVLVGFAVFFAFLYAYLFFNEKYAHK
ncbi:hypothetical protein HYC85_004245 [Camellia sinensis]|uniref:ABC transporter domain-containing protein n=1 Tax=Camellia sinensis TaxID=4442 RepID=A0A7J7HVZ9_CAMSI|nr:hypothetical protein HYC85_004245 [Camellia sinensis]